MILEALTDEEMYLVCILQDVSGLDLAEFTWHAAENEDGCFRAWAFQWTWWRCQDPLQIDQGARCVQEGTPVLTEYGWIPIEQVTPGTLVLTHRVGGSRSSTSRTTTSATWW